LHCLEHTRLCESSTFLNEHRHTCRTRAPYDSRVTNGTRALSESEELGADPGEPVQLLVNETRLAQSEVNSRKLDAASFGFRDVECGMANLIIGPCDILNPLCFCWQVELDIFDKKFVFKLKWGQMGPWPKKIWSQNRIGSMCPN